MTWEWREIAGCDNGCYQHPFCPECGGEIGCPYPDGEDGEFDETVLESIIEANFEEARKRPDCHHCPVCGRMLFGEE